MSRHLLTTLALVLLVGALAGPFAPIQPAYATSHSMAPVIDEGDLYFVYKDQSTAGVGDVVMFYSAERGQHVTHRVVDRVDGEFITQGDANPTTDQAAGHPPVGRSSVVGAVVAFQGQPFSVPWIGQALDRLQASRTALVLLIVALLIADFLISRGDPGLPERDVVHVGEVIRPLLIGSLVVSLFLIGLGASSHELTYVATASGNGPASVVSVGEPAERSISVEIWQPPLTTAIVSADGVTVLDVVRRPGTVDLRILVPPQAEKGPYRSMVHVTPYPATLPHGVLASLHGIHWLVALVASLFPVFGPAVVLYLLFFDGGTPIHPMNRRWFNRFGGG